MGMGSLDVNGFLKVVGDMISAIQRSEFKEAIEMIDELNPRQAACIMSAIVSFQPDNILAFGEFIGERMNGDR